jgi:hypothetical protein
MSQKICVISFDHWNYDHHIVAALQKKKIEAFHIKIGGFKHKNIFSKIHNTFCKVFLNRNPKLIKRQEYILEKLKENGIQDQILVINPETIDKYYHLLIKNYTKKYIAYLYDSVDRNPVEHLLNGVFDEIFSFDKEDVSKYGFKETCNYNYLNKPKTKTKQEQKVLYVGSFDNRMNVLEKIGDVLKKQNIDFKFLIIGKKSFLFKIKNNFIKKYKHLQFSHKRLSQKELIDKYSASEIIIDIVRDNQLGLSFRFFEAMALEKKIITNNANVKNYSFYNPINILVLDDNLSNLDTHFFQSEYENLPTNIYNEYTLKTWIEKTFSL